MSINFFIGKTYSSFKNSSIKYGRRESYQFVKTGFHYVLDILLYQNYQQLICIFVIGKNIEKTGIYWKEFFSQCKIFSFEPIKCTFLEFKKNIGKTANIKPFHVVILKIGFIFCGFYEHFRWGHGKMWLGFANALYVNKNFNR